jgi:hypothetical protein
MEAHVPSAKLALSIVGVGVRVAQPFRDEHVRGDRSYN